jgi:hypothetical protein
VLVLTLPVLYLNVAALVAAVLFSACESDAPPPQTPGNRAPIVRAAVIAPDPVLLSGPALVQVEMEDADNDQLTFRCQWYVDDRPLEGETGSKLDTQHLERGLYVWVEVVASDGKSESAPYRTKKVLVGNTPPEVRSVSAENPEPKVGEVVKLKIEAFDADDDSIDYTYRWWRNTTLVSEGYQSELPTEGFARSDTVVVEVTPHDRTGPGRPLMSNQIIMANAPPTITSKPPREVPSGRYQYLVTATDADRDTLSYKLEKAPTGMTIEKSTGLILWPLSVGMSGSYHVRVLVEDGQNGHAYQEFELSIPVAPTS